MPYLLVVFTETEQEISIGVQNKGVGPAFIKQSKLMLNNQTFDEKDYLVFLDSLFDFNPSYTYRNLQDRVLSPGDEVKLFTFVNEREIASVSKALREQQVSIDLCYCSVHEECWTRNSKGTNPSESCE